MISGTDIFYALLALTGGILSGYVHHIFGKLSQSVHDINLSLAGKPKEKTGFFEFVKECIHQVLDEYKKKKSRFRLFIVFLIISLLPYPIWQYDYILLIPTVVILFIFFRSLSLETFYEEKLARREGIASNFPTDFDDFLDRLEIEDKEEREELTKLYKQYEKKKTKKDRKELFDRLP